VHRDRDLRDLSATRPSPHAGSAVEARATPSTPSTPSALTIAGSDSGGGAGIQADLKAFASCGVHGTCAITAVTAQNTRTVAAVQYIEPDIVLAQVRAVISDIGADAVKVGMIGSAAVADAVARALDELPPGTPVVVDPVMVAESGARLIEPDAERVLIGELVPRASVLTPNLDEARMLAGAPRREGEEEGEAEALVRAVLALGPDSVVLTGGHRAGGASDLFLDSRGDGSIVAIDGERHAAGAAHGSGCTHSAVLAAQLALGHDRLQAARIARIHAGAAVARGLRDIGSGAGPVDAIDLAQRRLRGLP
jgi:hydroxymethylpyrimidine/phosphomethylpyrimidine kinase